MIDNFINMASIHEMHGHSPSGKKGEADTWVFNIEATSTLLIAAWYVFGVFLALGKAAHPEGAEGDALLAEFYAWGSHWVIPFLLAIFYLGAGYLFQKHQHVNDFASWRTYMRREFIVLLTPFFAFTILTLLTGSLVALEPELSRVGLVVDAPTFSALALLDAIFVHPVGPVGYFVVLLMIYVLAIFSKTPHTTQGMCVFIACAVAVKVVAIALSDVGLSSDMPYYLIQIMQNWIWFTLGVALRFFDMEKIMEKAPFAVIATVAFIACAVVLCIFDVTEAACMFMLTLLGLLSFYSLSAARFLQGRQDAFYGFVTRFTMAIWLMHQMLAQIVFCALFAIGFSPEGAFADCWIVVIAMMCLVACYALPIVIMNILSRVWKLGFIVYPARYLPAKI